MKSTSLSLAERFTTTDWIVLRTSNLNSSSWGSLTEIKLYEKQLYIYDSDFKESKIARTANVCIIKRLLTNLCLLPGTFIFKFDKNCMPCWRCLDLHSFIIKLFEILRKKCFPCIGTDKSITKIFKIGELPCLYLYTIHQQSPS